MADDYLYIDRDGDELHVRSLEIDGVPHAALGTLVTNGIEASVHVSPDRAWEVCEAILDAAGVDVDE